jgi:hypothetical protein
MSDKRMKPLEQYLRDDLTIGVFDHHLRTSLNTKGEVVFYIRSFNVEGKVHNFKVKANELIPRDIVGDIP